MLCVFSFASQANKKNKDEISGNIYTHAVDTIVSQIMKDYPSTSIVLCADEFILDRIPDTFSGQEIEKTKKYKPIGKYEGYIWIRIERFMINLDELYVFAIVKKQQKDSFVDLPDGRPNYRIKYLCDHDDKLYELVEISKGVSKIE